MELLSLITLQHHSCYIKQKPCFITFTWLTEQHSSFSDDEQPSPGSDMREWYFSKHVLHLQCASSAQSFVWAPSFCPRLAPILFQHNSAATAQAGDSASGLETMDLCERRSICFDRDLTFCSVQQQYMSNVLGSQPRDFPSFLRDDAGNEY